MTDIGVVDLIDNMLVVDPTKRYSIKHCMSHPWLNEGEAHVLAKVRAPERQRTLLSTTTGGGRLGYTSHTLPVRGSIHEDS